MNKLFAFFLTFFLSLTLSKSQTTNYHPFPDSGAVWNFYLQANCFQNGLADEHYSIFISGDTIINNQTYLKLTTPNVLSNSTGSCGNTSIGYKGAIREDTANKKVYIVPPSSNTEELLYDFTLQIGDTLKGHIGNLNPIVQSIDSVLVGSNYHKRWVIDSSCYFIYIIEGIGSTYGLLEEIVPPCVTDLPEYSLSCFQSSQYTYNTAGSCNLITALEEEIPLKSSLLAYPNPTSAAVHLELDIKLQAIHVYDIHGQMVQDINPNNRSWDLPEESGTYLIHVQDMDGRSYAKKIFKL